MIDFITSHFIQLVLSQKWQMQADIAYLCAVRVKA